MVDHTEKDTITVNYYIKQGRGRLKGSKNKQYFVALELFLSAKEKENLELLLKLQKNRIINNLGLPF
jgi:hypothetical protein